jgi:hypothetical protein
VSDFNDKAQALFSPRCRIHSGRCENYRRKLTAGFLQLARSYRELAIKDRRIVALAVSTFNQGRVIQTRGLANLRHSV